MNENQAIINIETTGIDPHKNHIYLINIFTNDRYYNFYSTNNETEEKIIKSAYKILQSKQIISFSEFDVKFINTKIIKYTEFNIINNCVYLQKLIKNYYKNSFTSLKAKDLASKLFDINIDDKSKSVKLYKKISKSNRISDELIEFSKTSMNFKIKLYNYMRKFFEENCDTFEVYSNFVRYLLYDIKKIKNNLEISLITDNKMEIDAMYESTQIKSQGMFITLCLSLHQGYIEDDFVECTMTSMDNNYNLINNYYPLVVNEEFIYDNIKELVKYTLTEIFNE
ncbi:MAG: ribonuclease H-like domain-containing protein [Finegoldia magna]|uniref:Ribonuclease H-like domain-containing protein n=1 Tax=Finegoldia magna TaxID=1260 RepID=A0A943LA48_FINMA|nr:ribonuclease H-like domain-containing protein [Finegoldia magna]MBS5965124.1 ribonuclease H-like domain-containing protein [Finegoldia magna]